MPIRYGLLPTVVESTSFLNHLREGLMVERCHNVQVGVRRFLPARIVVIRNAENVRVIPRHLQKLKFPILVAGVLVHPLDSDCLIDGEICATMDNTECAVGNHFVQSVLLRLVSLIQSAELDTRSFLPHEIQFLATYRLIGCLVSCLSDDIAYFDFLNYCILGLRLITRLRLFYLNHCF